MPASAFSDRHALYELCAQDAAQLVPFLRALHGQDPKSLREDFAGTAAIAREWVRTVPGGSAIAVDHDASALARCPDRAGLRAFVSDVLEGPEHASDVVHAGNFSLGYFHERAALLAYLARSRARLRPGGVFVCDTFGGPSAFGTGAVARDRYLPDGTRVRSTWETREADALSGLVLQALHFRADRLGDVVFELRDAFLYRWRVWSVPELRDALREAGFARTQVHDRLEGEHPPLPPREDFAVCLAAR